MLESGSHGAVRHRVRPCVCFACICSSPRWDRARAAFSDVHVRCLQYSVVIGMFSTLLPEHKDSSNTTVGELVAVGGHIIVEVQVKQGGRISKKRAVKKRGYLVSSLVAQGDLKARLEREQRAFEEKLQEHQVERRRLSRDLEAATTARKRIAAGLEARNAEISELRKDLDKREAHLRQYEADTSSQLAALRNVAGEYDSRLTAMQADRDDLRARLAVAERTAASVDAALRDTTSSHELNNRIQRLLVENASIKAQWTMLRTDMAARHARMREQLSQELRGQAQRQQSAFVQSLHDQLQAHSEQLQIQHDAFRESILAQFSAQRSAVDERALRMEESAQALSTEVHALLAALKRTQCAVAATSERTTTTSSATTASPETSESANFEDAASADDRIGRLSASASASASASPGAAVSLSSSTVRA